MDRISRLVLPKSRLSSQALTIPEFRAAKAAAYANRR